MHRLRILVFLELCNLGLFVSPPLLEQRWLGPGIERKLVLFTVLNFLEYGKFCEELFLVDF